MLALPQAQISEKAITNLEQPHMENPEDYWASKQYHTMATRYGTTLSHSKCPQWSHQLSCWNAHAHCAAGLVRLGQRK